MNKDIIGDAFPTQAGYNEVAELNNIVVLYPQTSLIMQNPYGCWDIFGYTGDDYGISFQLPQILKYYRVHIF